MNRILKISLVILIILFISLSSPNRPDKSIPKTVLQERFSLYLPLVSSGNKIPIGVVNDYFDWQELAPYYYGDFLKVGYNAHFFETEGWPRIDMSVNGYEGDLMILFSGAFSWWVQPICAPIPEVYWDAWVDEFSAPIIRHLGSDRVKWVSLMNEPDTKFSGYAYWLGCWGDTYEAGVYYARFVNHAGSRIKEYFPNIRVVAGEFIDVPSPFMYGFRDSVENADVISFHHHYYCSSTQAPEYVDAVTSRVEIMQSNFSIQVMLSETSMIYADGDSDICEQRQADYYDFLGTVRGVEAIAWHSLACNSWGNSSMIDPCDPPHLKQVFFAYRESKLENNP